MNVINVEEKEVKKLIEENIEELNQRVEQLEKEAVEFRKLQKNKQDRFSTRKPKSFGRRY